VRRIDFGKSEEIMRGLTEIQEIRDRILGKGHIVSMCIYFDTNLSSYFKKGLLVELMNNNLIHILEEHKSKLQEELDRI